MWKVCISVILKTWSELPSRMDYTSIIRSIIRFQFNSQMLLSYLWQWGWHQSGNLWPWVWLVQLHSAGRLSQSSCGLFHLPSAPPVRFKKVSQSLVQPSLNTVCRSNRVMELIHWLLAYKNRQHDSFFQYRLLLAAALVTTATMLADGMCQTKKKGVHFKYILPKII